jgi:hypothetical protein
MKRGMEGTNAGTYYGTNSGAFRVFEQLRENDGIGNHADYQVIVARRQADFIVSGGYYEGTYRRAHTST